MKKPIRTTLTVASLLGLVGSTLAQAPAPSSASSPAAKPIAETPADPHQWLEDVLGERALGWVKERNQLTLSALQARPDFAPLRAELKEVLLANDRIPRVGRMGDAFYNLWQDAKNKRGIWRRTSMEEYRKAEPKWETVLDLDALGAQEKESWVFHGAQCLAPSYQRCLISLSRGGSDAAVVREFDTRSKRFISDGFTLPEAKSSVEWIDENTIYVGTDFGPGSLTDSGYVRVIKRWQRGTPLSSATTVFEGERQDVAVSVQVDHSQGKTRTVFYRALDFYNQAAFLLQDKALKKVDIPSDVRMSFWRDKVLLAPRADWSVDGATYPAGSLLLGSSADFLKGQRKFMLLFKPSATRSLANYTVTRQHVLLTISDKVASRLEEWSFEGKTPRHRTVNAPFPGNLSVQSLYDADRPGDRWGSSYFLNYTDFLTPDTLWLAKAGRDGRDVLKTRAAQFDAKGMRAEQLFAKSKDGTEVPYFVVWPAGAKADGKNPTLLYGYGGFEVAMEPGYSGGRGRAWLARGGVFVLANIRGGGEFGPQWHQAAIKANKQRSYDDFIAVAEDLIARGITTPRHLGIMGGSNGGLLVGATLVQRPELFNAVVCQVPLLDMRRFHTLLAGASWMGEYGNPDDPAEWAFISKYSPYHNLKAGVKYPKVLIDTSTRDDRVHPGHARKMAARMLELGNELYYYENIEGGHGGAADNEQRATWQAIEYTYLWQQLGR